MSQVEYDYEISRFGLHKTNTKFAVENDLCLYM